MTELTDRGKAFRSTIAAFIEARREVKLSGKEGNPSIEAQFDYGAWLKNAAERVDHIEVVTHVLKATHPSAKGSNVYVSPTSLPNRDEVGTHSLGTEFVDDIAVDNARHLDIYSFLKQPFEGRQLRK